ncbi:hypothetical protein AD948_06365 [Acetobacter senegalensis]|uniref:Uncharacterized protein n=1 Tax=Acetobacter senegalensis TaxID=446692 RepID=A0A149U417_9PROT|nr:hypothetical protein [Acetobacter senegalensis]KXV60138.1 hypothetical protein AD948_06365 [Acetobacter senegalensis]
MSETVLDELVIRLGLDTSSLQSDARQAVGVLDTLTQKTQTITSQSEKASKQAASSFSQTRKEALGLLGVLSGGRGLASLLKQMQGASQKTTLSGSSQQGGGAGQSSRSGFARGINRFSHAPHTMHAPASSRASRSKGPLLPLQRMQQQPSAFFTPSPLSVPERHFQVQAPSRPSQQAPAFLSSHDRSLSTTSALVRPASLSSRVTLQHTTVLTQPTSVSGRAYNGVLPTKSLTEALRSTVSAAMALYRPQSLRTPRPLFTAFSVIRQANPKSRGETSPLSFNRMQNPVSSFPNAAGLMPPTTKQQTDWRRRQPSHNGIPPNSVRGLSYSKAASPFETFGKNHRPLSGKSPSSRTNHLYRYQNHTLAMQHVPMVPSVPEQRLSAQARRQFSLLEPSSSSRTNFPPAPNARLAPVSPMLENNLLHQGVFLSSDALKLMQPFLPGSPMLRAASSAAASVPAPQAPVQNTTHIGSVTISVPSGNPQKIAQALRGLGGGDSHTLTSLATYGAV